jgi:hypothetical protein
VSTSAVRATTPPPGAEAILISSQHPMSLAIRRLGAVPLPALASRRSSAFVVAVPESAAVPGAV